MVTWLSDPVTLPTVFMLCGLRPFCLSGKHFCGIQTELFTLGYRYTMWWETLVQHTQHSTAISEICGGWSEKCSNIQWAVPLWVKKTFFDARGQRRMAWLLWADRKETVNCLPINKLPSCSCCEHVNTNNVICFFVFLMCGAKSRFMLHSKSLLPWLVNQLTNY